MTGYERTAITKDRIKEAMAAAGKTQADLVRETGLNRGTISRYLSGAVEPRQDATHKIAVALDVSEMWLWGYDVPKQRSASQKKNDHLAQVVVKLRSDNDFYEDVMMLDSLQPADRAAVHQLLVALNNK